MTTWSDLQIPIFRDVATGHGHTVVVARAGSGKTTTIVEAFKHVPAGMTALMVAFNKSIATELGARAPAGVDVKTLHAYGFAAVRKAFGKVRVENHKTYELLDARRGNARDVGDGVLEKDLRAAVAKLVSLAKGQPGEPDHEALDALIDAFDIECLSPRDVLVTEALAILALAKTTTHVIDFDDMVWLPVVLGLKCPRYDRVFVDETQDLNPCQVELALRAVKPKGRIMAVGDDRQAIYQFRGAGANTVGSIIDRLQAKILPLSVTYRCPLAVVAVAQVWVPDLTAAPGAAEGLVTACLDTALLTEAMPGDFILSRSNAPLVGLCLAFLKARRRAMIKGRDVGASLTALIKRLAAKDVPELATRLEAWVGREVARLEGMSPPRSTDLVVDKAACIGAFLDGAATVAEVVTSIEALFKDQDDTGSIVLSTTHKAKGLERDKVFMLRWTYRPEKGGEEENLAYVAVTRAKKHLVMVSQAK